MSRALLSVVASALGMGFDAPMASARERAHAQVRAEIVEAGRRQLAATGASGLSLRSVAREVGLVSSAVYRYFPSRDELLTALIVDAYGAVGSAAVRAEARAPREDLPARWMALTRGVRRWARGHRHEWALIFGSPVPGYHAPAATIDPAARIPLAMAAIVGVAPPPADRSLPTPTPRLRRDLEVLAGRIAPGTGDEQLVRALMAWTALVGAVSFELFGHLHQVVRDYDGWFDHQMAVLAHGLGIRA